MRLLTCKVCNPSLHKLHKSLSELRIRNSEKIDWNFLAAVIDQVVLRNHGGRVPRHVRRCGRYGQYHRCVEDAHHRSHPLSTRKSRTIFCHESVRQWSSNPSWHQLPLQPTPFQPKQVQKQSLSSYAKYSSQSKTNASNSHFIETRVNELERACYEGRLKLSQMEVKREIWPLLSQCAVAGDKWNNQHNQNDQSELISKAELSNRLLKLCLEGVEARRVELWQWLDDMNGMQNIQNSDTNDGISDQIGKNYDEPTKFSPNLYWKEAPHPTTEMYNLALTAWKNVIDSHSNANATNFSNTDNCSNIFTSEKIQDMECAAQVTSNLLLLMEDEYSNELHFIQAFNSRLRPNETVPAETPNSSNSTQAKHCNDRNALKRYPPLRQRTAIPDVKNYTKVLESWGRCVGGSIWKRPRHSKYSHRSPKLHQPQHAQHSQQSQQINDWDGLFQSRLRLEATAIESMMEWIESMEDSLYAKHDDEQPADANNSPSSSTTPLHRHRPPPDRVCYNILLQTMARQTNPSLYEMRLVLQRMMERVKYELEHDDDTLEQDDFEDGADDADGVAAVDNDKTDVADDTDMEESGRDQFPTLALSFFPDVFSYNALIEAHANRSAMFAMSNPDHRQSRNAKNNTSDSHCRDNRDTSNRSHCRQNVQPQQNQQHSQPMVPISTRSPLFHQRIMWQSPFATGTDSNPSIDLNVQSQNLHPNQQQHLQPKPWPKANTSQHSLQHNSQLPKKSTRSNKLSSSEKEAILAEQLLDEMCHLNTMQVIPNSFSYNAVIKAWIRSGSERGLQRSVDILLALAENNCYSTADLNEDAFFERDRHLMDGKETMPLSPIQPITSPAVFGKFSKWWVSSSGKEQKGMQHSAPIEVQRSGSRVSETRNHSSPSFSASSDSNDTPSNLFHIIDIDRQKPVRRSPPTNLLIGVGMGHRLNYLQSAIDTNQSNSANTPSSYSNRNSTDNNRLESHPSPQKQYSPSSDVFNIGRILEKEDLSASPLEAFVGHLPYIPPNVHPTPMTFKLTIDALGRQGTRTSAEIAEKLLFLSNTCFLKQIEEKEASKSYISNSDVHDESISSFEEILGGKMNLALFNSVLQSWAKAGKEASGAENSLPFYAALRADGLLTRILEQRGDALDWRIAPQPNASSFLSVLRALEHAASFSISKGDYASAQKAAKKAEAVLDKLVQSQSEYCNVTLLCFGCVIRTWANLAGKSKHGKGNAELAQAALERMIDGALSDVSWTGHLELDLIDFNSVLGAWVRDLEMVASTENANTILSKISNLYDFFVKVQSGCNPLIRFEPDSSTFNHVIRACYAPWSSSFNHGDIASRKKALDLAYDIYTRMIKTSKRSHYYPNAHTYSHVFKAIACLLPSSDAAGNTDDKMRLCKSLFEDCCHNGHLTKTTFWVFRKLFQDETDFVDMLHSQLKHCSSLNKERILSIPENSLYDYLPAEWSRHGRKFNALHSSIR